MKILEFYKMVASGNDFIVIDNRKGNIKNARLLTQKWCALHSGVGADGVLLFEKSKKAAFKMRIINSDGSEAEACGNGFRCIALYARKILKFPASFSFESLSGIIDAKVMSGDRVRVRLARPRDLRRNAKLTADGQKLTYSFINTGVPHAVIFVKNLSRVEVARLGRAIRQHQDFKPKGTNVNFVQVQSAQQVCVRTYERGVEAETLACGTGSTASAILSVLLGYTRPPVAVKTAGGEVLKIDFKFNEKIPEEVTLEGKAHIVFKGTLVL